MLGLVRRISDQRHRLIVGRAEPFLEEGEVVVQWVRARRTDGRGAGFVFLTDKQCVVVWTGKANEHTSVRWEDLSSWGLQLDAKGGPLLGVETEHGGFFVQVVAATGRMAEDVGSFIRRFAYLAGAPNKLLTHPVHGSFHHHSSAHVDAEKKSIGGLTKRFLITLLGAVMITVGVLIILLPGPWSFPLIIGGLAVLGSEYDWAKDTMEWTKAKYKQARAKIEARRRSKV